MSHKKSKSIGLHVPFSWEKMPGVPKFMASPMRAPNTNVQVPSLDEARSKVLLPLPPAGSSRNVVNVVSKRISLWEEDPFLTAIRECTKDLDDYKGKGEIKKNFRTRVHMSKFYLLSCKRSFDVKESIHALMKPSSLGSFLQKERP